VDGEATAREVTGSPPRHLSWLDAASVAVGIVIGSGIFMAPALVAHFAGGGGAMMLAWAAGGVLCVCGALCYAELASLHPHSGGEYVYLSRSWGRAAGFLFVWARATVIQTGSIAAAAYVFGEYAARLLGAAPRSAAALAVAAVATLTVLNAVGLRSGRWTQNVLTAVKMAGLLAIVAAALVGPAAQPVAQAAPATTPLFGLAMVFVLYTFGGWNEVAYVAGEVRDAPRKMLWALMGSLAAVTLLYLAVAACYWRLLGLAGMASSEAVAADAVSRVVGSAGARAVSALIAASALGAVNGCIATGARSVWALGSDWRAFGLLGRWHARFRTPFNAVLLQGGLTVVLVLLPELRAGFRAVLGSGFRAAVEYTAPVFWLFFLLTGLSVAVLRWKERQAARAFRVPLYPLPVIAFCLMCAYMLYSSLAYTKPGALVGAAVLAAGVPVYLLVRRSRPAAS